MSPVHSPDAPGTYLLIRASQRGAAEPVAPLLGKFVRIL